MKKLYLLLLLTSLIFFGCTGGKKEKELLTKKCTLVSDQSASGYVNTTSYEINYENEIVNTVKQTETIDSSDKNILNFFKEQLEIQYKNANDLYSGYSYTIKEEDNKLIFVIDIDYKKVNMTKFVEDNPGMKSYVNSDNKVTLDGIIKMYENIGAECK